ncbi:T9SS type A sorting domain-containing protein [Candidatus Syntrophosphaera thermopropionivorans]|uniref:T9SS type A sorting domain-containing protein n=1 Tax=Candidatus Syntrophosphaera thermopropionivorans TaxID=2593015 RepID=A0AC61QHT4_9BACT|nr:T9SS type A sorting domain-containing protein [Candidatus Syntrophosphaera thermopropionivorans]TDF72525.1 T9SS type A sorting domain-containing protein [Candidatus Syntrophosphaera thermopropionivorans]
MKRFLLIMLSFSLFLGLNAIVTEVGSFRGFFYGSEPACEYDNWTSHIAEGILTNTNVYAPWEVQNNNFGNYIQPTDTMLNQWEEVVVDFLNLNLDSAQAKINQYGFPYEIVQFQDLDSGRNLFFLREALNNIYYDSNQTPSTEDDEIGSFDYGWGLFVYDPYASRSVIITVPHPCDDYPAPVFGLEVFYQLDARFFLISGAGREVLMSNPNNVDTSLSDPSRNANHPFNVFYQKGADQIRNLTGKREFSLQIHTYDWNKYPGKSNIMFSAGKYRLYPALPLRDNSLFHHDLIHKTPYLVHPANSIGNNTAVSIQNYYSVYYAENEPVVYHYGNQLITIPLNEDLPGYPLNRQMLYSENPNMYDVYSSFLHVEMDELPAQYNQNTTNWRWFYGYDADTNTWNIEQCYTRFIQYYRPWLNALTEVIDSMLILNDGIGPTNPSNLQVTALSSNNLTFTWNRSYSYDFDSYIIELHYENNGENVNCVYNRDTIPNLAWQNLHSLSLELPLSNKIYYLKMQARDKNLNYSLFTEEIEIWHYFPGFAYFNGTPLDSAVNLIFTSTFSSIQGFNIYRKENEGPSLQIASWTDNPALQPNQSQLYFYLDTGLANNHIYRYKISVVYNNGFEQFHWKTLITSPYRTYDFNLYNQNSGMHNVLSIGINPLAKDNEDYYDEVCTYLNGSLILISISPDSLVFFSKDVRTDYDLDSLNKCWLLRYRCSSPGQSLFLFPPSDLINLGYDLLLYDVNKGLWADLRLGPYCWVNSDTQWHNFELYWGKSLPQVQFHDEFQSLSDLFVFQTGTINLHYRVINRHRVQSVNLYFVSFQDTILIQEGLPPEITDWQVQNPPLLKSAQLMVRLYLTDGSTLNFYSQRRFNVIPQNIQYHLPAGYSFLSFPVSNFNHLAWEVLGESSLTWILNSFQQWEITTQLNRNQGFLVYHPEPYDFSIPAELPAYTVTLNISPGWNLLPNPYYHQFEIKDLYFYHSYIFKNYNDLVGEELIYPFVYLYDSNGFTLSKIVPPARAFFFYYGGKQPLQIVFNPKYYDGPPVLWQDRWNAIISISDGIHTRDNIQIGSSDDSTPDYDFLYDLLKAPAFPKTPYKISLINPDDRYVVPYQSDYKGLYPDYDPVDKLWNYQIELNTLTPLCFNFYTSMPEDYAAELCFEQRIFPLIKGQELWITPSTTGILTGWFKIKSYVQGTSNSEIVPLISIYPNPFHQELKIEVKNPSLTNAKISIYNLRGQKIWEKKIDKSSPNPIIWNGKDYNNKSLPAGIYLLKIYVNKENTYLYKLIRY